MEIFVAVKDGILVLLDGLGENLCISLIGAWVPFYYDGSALILVWWVIAMIINFGMKLLIHSPNFNNYAI